MPIVDLRLLFEMPFGPYTNTTVVVVLRVGDVTSRTVGIVVDAVSDSHNVHPDEIRESPNFGDVVSTECINGITRIDDNMVILLDVDMLLHIERLG